MLAKIFTGDTTIRRLKHDKGRYEVGLLAELLKHAPREFLDALLRLYNDVSYTGEPPVSWSETLFTTLPEKMRAKQSTDFIPIANLRVFFQNLHTSSLEDCNMYFMQCNLKNNMVSVQDDDVKNTFY